MGGVNEQKDVRFMDEEEVPYGIKQTDNAPHFVIDGYSDGADPVRTDIEGRGDIEVGVTQVEIAITGVTKSIRIQADTSNAGIIYIGKIGVLSDGTNDFV